MVVEMDRSTIGKVAAAIGVGVGAYFIYKKIRARKIDEKWVEVGKINEIFIFPIKSCKGISVSEARCEKMALRAGEHIDRAFVVADEDGKFLTAREVPKMVLIDNKVENNILSIAAPGKKPIRVDLNKVLAEKKVKRVTVWDLPIDAYDCGSEVATWLTEHLGQPSGPRYRLFYYVPGLYNSRSLKNFEKLAGYFKRKHDTSIFPDLTPYMLMTEPSMDDVNTRTPNGEQFSIRNFRPNFTVVGTKPFDEDNWVRVKIGNETEFTNVKPCTRCVLTTINWATGEKHPRTEPLRTLRSYRVSQVPEEKKYFGYSPMLGINLAIDRLGIVRVGDPVYVTYKK